MNQKKENLKDVNYYRKMLHHDTIVLLIVSILFIIVSIYSLSKITYADDLLFSLFFKSILFLTFEVALLINKKVINKAVGCFAIINGILMVITSIADESLFGIVYLFLGIFYIIHSIIYLNKLKNHNYDEQIINNNKKIVN